MKIYTCCLLVLLITVNAFAQKEKKAEPSFYVFNEKEEPCKIEDARYIGILEKLADTVYQWKYYSFSGPMIRIETYRDPEMTTPHGYFAFFDSKGIIDSSGHTFNGRKDKIWHYYSDSLTVWRSEEYNKGALLKRMNEAELRAQRDHLTHRHVDNKPDSLAKEATPKGDSKAWMKYLQNNISFPERAKSFNKQGSVMI